MMQFGRRVAIFTLIDDRGRMLCQLRDSKPRYRPNMWGFFGGGIESGETPEQAVIREAREELQIDLKPTFFGHYAIPRPEDGPSRELFLFTASLTWNLETLRSHQREGAELGLFTIDEISQLNMFWDDKRMLEDVAAKKAPKGTITLARE
ncbi:NUDIX domain-containing protein [Candidatus Woesearchaeota archaeon]|nr:NUDIX domain-containing protein [Candidatus Woesearchaeota archaeon]